VVARRGGETIEGLLSIAFCGAPAGRGIHLSSAGGKIGLLHRSEEVLFFLGREGEEKGACPVAS